MWIMAGRTPARFGQLADLVSRYRGTRVPDSTLTDVKNRLLRRGIIELAEDAQGQPAYHLTAAGRARAEELRVVAEACPTRLEPSRSSERPP